MLAINTLYNETQVDVTAAFNAAMENADTPALAKMAARLAAEPDATQNDISKAGWYAHLAVTAAFHEGSESEHLAALNVFRLLGSPQFNAASHY